MCHTTMRVPPAPSQPGIPSGPGPAARACLPPRGGAGQPTAAPAQITGHLCEDGVGHCVEPMAGLGGGDSPPCRGGTEGPTAAPWFKKKTKTKSAFVLVINTALKTKSGSFSRGSSGAQQGVSNARQQRSSRGLTTSPGAKTFLKRIFSFKKKNGRNF